MNALAAKAAAMHVDHNVVYGMLGPRSAHGRPPPETQNGYGIVYQRPAGTRLARPASLLGENPACRALKRCLPGYPFAINHRQAPRFKYPAAIEDAQRAVRYVRQRLALGHSGGAHRAGGGSSGGLYRHWAPFQRWDRATRPCQPRKRPRPVRVALPRDLSVLPATAAVRPSRFMGMLPAARQARTQSRPRTGKGLAAAPRPPTRAVPADPRDARRRPPERYAPWPQRRRRGEPCPSPTVVTVRTSPAPQPA